MMAFGAVSSNLVLVLRILLTRVGFQCLILLDELWVNELNHNTNTNISSLQCQLAFLPYQENLLHKNEKTLACKSILRTIRNTRLYTSTVQTGALLLI